MLSLQNARENSLANMYQIAANYTSKVICVREEQILTNDVLTYPQSTDGHFLSTFLRFFSRWLTFTYQMHQLLKDQNIQLTPTEMDTKCHQSASFPANRLFTNGQSYALFYYIEKEYLAQMKRYLKHLCEDRCKQLNRAGGA